MSTKIEDRIAIVSFATAGVAEEFEMLKFSFELFHGTEFHWFIRCDDYIAERLSPYPKVHCQKFAGAPANRPESHTEQSQLLMAQKMNVVRDALQYKDWEAIAYMDADLVVTSEFFGKLIEIPGDAVLTPNHFANKDYSRYGRYNAGFMFLRSRAFLDWWQEAYLAQPWLFSDQQCLNDAPKHFKIAELGPNANVGAWRRDDEPLVYHPIPADCMFLHVHLFDFCFSPEQIARDVFNFEMSAALATCNYKPCFSGPQLLQYAFAVHCLQFMATSKERKHQILFVEILKRDRLGLLASLLARACEIQTPASTSQEPFIQSQPVLKSPLQASSVLLQPA